MKKSLRCFALCALPILGAANGSCAQKSVPATVDLKTFRLDKLLQPRGFVAEKPPAQTFGSLDAKRSPKLPISNQRWFRGRNRIEASVMILADEAKARSFNENYLRGHSLRPVSPFDVLSINGVRDNQKRVPTTVSFIYNLIAVGRVYIVIEAVCDDQTRPQTFSPTEFARLVQSVKNQLIARSRAVPQS